MRKGWWMNLERSWRERLVDKCGRVVDKYIWRGARGKSILNFQLWKVMTSFPKFKLS